MILTEAAQTRTLLFCAATLVAGLFLGAAVLWSQQREITWLRGEVEDAHRSLGQLAPLVDDLRVWALDVHDALFTQPAQRPHDIQNMPDPPRVPETAPQAATEARTALHGASENEPAPATEPIPRQPGPDTAPAHAVAGDALNRILAEHRAAMARIQGGK